jgi:hypothetical protein
MPQLATPLSVAGLAASLLVQLLAGLVPSLLALALSSSAPRAQSLSPPPGAPFAHPDGTTHWYEVIATPQGITWPEAARAAAERGGYLATLKLPCRKRLRLRPARRGQVLAAQAPDPAQRRPLDRWPPAPLQQRAERRLDLERARVLDPCPLGKWSARRQRRSLTSALQRGAGPALRDLGRRR